MFALPVMWLNLVIYFHNNLFLIPCIHMNDVVPLTLFLLLRIYFFNNLNMGQMKDKFFYCSNLIFFMEFMYWGFNQF